MQKPILLNCFGVWERQAVTAKIQGAYGYAPELCQIVMKLLVGLKRQEHVGYVCVWSQIGGSCCIYGASRPTYFVLGFLGWAFAPNNWVSWIYG